MNRLVSSLCRLFVVSAALQGLAFAAGVKSDLPPAAKRKACVDLALLLAHAPAPVPVDPTLKTPFHPEGFNQPDLEDNRGKGIASPGTPKVLNDKDILTSIAEKIVPSGTASLGGEPFLIIRQKKIKKGESLSISFDGHDYEVEITDIQRTTFSLRLNKAEITRPIKNR